MRHFLAVLTTALCVSAAAPVLADTSGLVRGTAKLGGRPATAVTITLRGEGATLRTQTDAAGTFVLARVPFGRYVFTAHAPNVSDFTQTVDVQSDAVVDLAFDMQLKEIGRTRAASTKGPGGTPVSVNTIGREQLATLPENRSLNDVIATIPGIARFSYNEPVAHGFHGLTYELDGVPLPQGTTSNFSEIIDPRTIDSLEVFTGAFPAEFGGSRQGAVVNILSHRASDATDAHSGSLSLGAGSYGDAELSLSESARFGATRVFLNVNNGRTDRGIDSPTFVPIHDRSNTADQFLRSITSVGKYDTLTFDASNSTSLFEIPINVTSSDTDPIAVPRATDDVQREYSRFVNLTYTKNAANGGSYTQISPWYRYDRVAYDGDIPSDLAGGSDGLRQDRRSEFEGLRLGHFHVLGKHALKLGVEGSLENFLGNEQIVYATSADGSPLPAPQNFFDDAAQRGTQVGAYLQDKWTPTTYFSVQAGLRYDHSTGYAHGAQLSPRLEINGQVDPQDILHAYYGRLYAAPFLEDTRRAAIVLGGASDAALPAYGLQPEHDQYYEVGLAHTLGQAARATINFWKRDVRNVLDTTQLANTPIFAVFNNTIGIAKGVEGRVDARSSNGDALFFSTTLSSSRAGGISGSTFLFPPNSGPDDVTLNPEDHDQTFSAELGLTKKFGYERSFFATLEPEYGTGYPVEFQNGSGRLPPHLTLNASVGREPTRGPRPRLGFNATFENVGNVRYVLKVNNGFNTTQWAPGFRANLRVTAPL